MKRKAGFTIVEVMVSLGVMTIGAMAIIGMQAQTTRANTYARELTVATQIAQNWIERLKIDDLRWAASTGVPNVDLGQTNFLAAIGTPANVNTFMALPELTVGTGPSLIRYSNGFDYYGNDVTTAGTPMTQVRYCASYRLNWIYQVDAALAASQPQQQQPSLMRADVRVFWPVAGVNADLSTDFPNCADDNVKLKPGGTQYGRYHVIYLSTVLRHVRFQ